MRSLVLWPTSRCNLHCQYCYAACVPPEDMTEDTVRAALQSMGDQPFSVQIAGGEPLCHWERTFQMIREASASVHCRTVSLQTNATLVTPAIADCLARYRVAVGVSLDGMPEINQKQRGLTEQALCGIQLLGQAGLNVTMTCVVTAANAGSLDRLADLALYLGNVRGIGLDLLRLSGRAKSGTGEVQRAEETTLLAGLQALCRRLDQINRQLPANRQLVLREEQKAREQLLRPGTYRDYCYASQGNAVVVLPDGRCTPCGSLAGDPAYDMGNVHKEIREKSLVCGQPEACMQCDYRSVCSGGCPSRGLLCGGFDPLDCVIKQYMFQRVSQSGRTEQDPPAPFSETA